MTAETPPHVIVVGGGVAGLVLARDLVAGGIRVTLLEASDRLGGKVAPHTLAGIELDAGAESFATRGGTVASLATELGLAHALVSPAGSGAWLLPRQGAAIRLPRAGLLGIPSVPLSRDVIDVIGLPGALRAQLDSLMGGFVGSKESTLGALVRKRMGRKVLDRLVSPVVTAIHSAHPDDLAVDVVAPRLRKAVLSQGSLSKAVLTIRGAAPAGAAVQGLYGGVFLLVEALAQGLSGRAEVVLGARVAAVEERAVVLDDGSRHPGDLVVLATELGAPTGVPITIATLVLDLPALDAAPRGTGVLVARGAAGVSAKALTHASVKWAWLAKRSGGAHVVRLSYESAPETDQELGELARSDASHLLGLEIPTSSVIAFDRWTWTGPALDADLKSTVPSGVVQVGERVAGTGLAAVILQARAEAGNILTDLAGEVKLRWTES